MLLQNYLEMNAGRYPQKPALIAGSEHVTYLQLNRSSSKLAHILSKRGVSRGDRVAIFLPNSKEAALGIWAVLKADAAFLPLNSTMKFEKLITILNDCRPTAIIMNEQRTIDPVKLSDSVPSINLIIVCNKDRLSGDERFMTMSDALEQGNDVTLSSHNIDMDLAYMIYTSGSTGIPKGVMMTHKNALSAATSIISYLENREEDIILNCLPLSFDYGLYQVLMAIMFGGTIVLEKGFNYPQTIINRIKELNVTGFPVVPTMVAMLLEMENFNEQNISSLRYITNTGAVLPVEHIKKMGMLFPTVKIFSMYGLTECKRVSYLPPEQLSIRPSSVGKAMPNVEAFIVDENGALVHPGETGELVVRGANVMSGYWERPEETAKILRSGTYPGEKVLYTGDFFKTDEEGYLYFMGRKDDMIKTRGERVSPSEIERVLIKIPGVKEAAVIGIPDPILGQAIAVYIVPSTNAEIDCNRVMKFAAEHLENFMIPKTVEIVSKLPHTSSGKIDKKAIQGRGVTEAELTQLKTFSKETLSIGDCQQTINLICDFINTQVSHKFKRNGAVIGISGGIDSSVAAVLTRKALGRERVVGLILPEKETDPKSKELAEDLAIQFDIHTEMVDLTPMCEAFDVYKKREAIVRTYFPEYDPSRHQYKLVLPGSLLEKEQLNVYRLALVSKDGTCAPKRLNKEDYLGMVAATSIKQRLRMVTLYYYAERENYLVVGTTNKSELDLAFFVRYGDAGVDIEPLAGLFKTQIFQLGAYLGIPDEIIKRPPTADVYSALSEDSEFYFRLPYERLDPLLYAWEHNVPLNEVMNELQVTQEQIERIYRDFEIKKNLSKRLQMAPIEL